MKESIKFQENLSPIENPPKDGEYYVSSVGDTILTIHHEGKPYYFKIFLGNITVQSTEHENWIVDGNSMQELRDKIIESIPNFID